MKKPVVLVLRADDTFSAGLRQFGADVLNLALIDVRAVGDDTAITDAIGRLREYDGLFFTSSFAASIFLERLGSGRDILDTHIYVLGMRARRVFDRAGISVHYRGEANTAAEMIAAFGVDQFVEDPGALNLIVAADAEVGRQPAPRLGAEPGHPDRQADRRADGAPRPRHGGNGVLRAPRLGAMARPNARRPSRPA